MGSSSRFAARVVDSESAFSGLANELNTLATKSVPASLFLRYEWLEAAWAWRRQEGARLHVVEVRDRNELVLVCPLVICDRSYRGLRFRSLEFLSVPDTQISGLICRPNLDAGALGAAAKMLIRDRSRWDLAELTKVADEPGPADALASCLAAAESDRLNLPGDANHCVALSGTWGDYYQSRRRSLKKSNNLAKNKLSKAFRTLEVVHSGDPEFDRWIPDLEHALKQVSRGSWKGPEGVALDAPGPAAFLQVITGHARKAGWLSTWFLLADGEPIALEYQLCYQGRAHALRGDYVEDHASLSPGTYLNWVLLERMFGTGLTEYQMGPGSNRYKDRWTTHEHPLRTIRVYGVTPRGRVLKLLDQHLRPLVSRLRRLLRRE